MGTVVHMSTPNDWRIVTPQEADALLKASETDRTGRSTWLLRDQAERYAHTVATEPERIAAAKRAAVVKALRDLEDSFDGRDQVWISSKADAIEHGAEW